MNLIHYMNNSTILKRIIKLKMIKNFKINKNSIHLKSQLSKFKKKLKVLLLKNVKNNNKKKKIFSEKLKL